MTLPQAEGLEAPVTGAVTWTVRESREWPRGRGAERFLPLFLPAAEKLAETGGVCSDCRDLVANVELQKAG